MVESRGKTRSPCAESVKIRPDDFSQNYAAKTSYGELAVGRQRLTRVMDLPNTTVALYESLEDDFELTVQAALGTISTITDLPSRNRDRPGRFAPGAGDFLPPSARIPDHQPGPVAIGLAGLDREIELTQHQ
jgi:hypothetical protein